MSLLRAFIAVEIPHEIHRAIERNTEKLRSTLSPSLVRWVPINNVHLTMKFLGDISPANVDILAHMLSLEVSQHSPLKIQIGNLGVFPNIKRPRVIWIGLQAPISLEALHRGIEAAAATVGYPVEKHPFSPHLTIGRVKKNIGSTGIQQIRNALQNTKIGPLGSAKVTDVHLFKSDLQPSGAVYTRLHSAQLGEP